MGKHILISVSSICVTSWCRRYTGWLCRSMISATSFSLTGVINKFLTVLLNATLWSKHSSPLGMAAVCGCLAAGAFYEQAPMRDAQASVSTKSAGRKTRASKRVKASAGQSGGAPTDEEEKESLRLNPLHQ